MQNMAVRESSKPSSHAEYNSTHRGTFTELEEDIIRLLRSAEVGESTELVPEFMVDEILALRGRMTPGAGRPRRLVHASTNTSLIYSTCP